MQTLISDGQWGTISGHVCRVVNFVPMAQIAGGKVLHTSAAEPYALVTFTCSKFSSDVVGAITQKEDFLNLSQVLALAAKSVEQGQGETEVIVSWVKSELRWPRRIFSRFMPGLSVMICKAGSYELMTDNDHLPELSGEARWLAMKPLVKLDPDYLL